MNDPYLNYPGAPHLVMTFQQWLEFEFNPWELILNASAIDGSDFHQQHPLGISVFLTPALPPDPRDFKPTFQQDQYANAIFRLETTTARNDIRRRVAKQIAPKDWIFQDMREGNTRLSPAETIEQYSQSRFTISPRGFGLDCHRNYEALIWRSIPIICGADETLREKYAKLPVHFVDTYATLTMALLDEWYAAALKTKYDFNHLVRAYWEDRRPDVDIVRQSVFWLKRFEVFDNVSRYFRDTDRETIDNTNPQPLQSSTLVPKKNSSTNHVAECNRLVREHTERNRK